MPGVNCSSASDGLFHLAKLVIPGTFSFFTWDCAETTETLTTAMQETALLLSQLLP